MLAYDVFTNNAFAATEIQEAVGNIVYIPQTLNEMGIFEERPIRTTTVGVTKKGNSLMIVPTTERGAPEVLPGRDTRNLVQLSTLRLAQTDRINGDEVQNIIQEFMPFGQALANAQDEVDSRQRKLMDQLELTRERHRLAALQGILLDADNSVLMNFFTQFGISQPAPITFNFTALNEGALRSYVQNQVTRPMIRQLQARQSYVPGVRLGALCGDAFYDALVTAPEIYKTYLNWSAAAELREANIWQTFRFAGVDWINFMGSDDNSTIAIASDECKFFPIGAKDVFIEYRAPGEDWREVNTLGKEFYSYVVPDVRAPSMFNFVDIFLYAYPLFACIAPEVLLRGELP